MRLYVSHQYYMHNVLLTAIHQHAFIRLKPVLVHNVILTAFHRHALMRLKQFIRSNTNEQWGTKP